MDPDVITLFRALADRSPAERDEYFARNPLPPAVRAEVESLLRFDGIPGPSLTSYVADAVDAIDTNVAAGGRCGAYTLLEPLGRGGMGSVWLAERNDGRFTGRTAIKFLHLALLDRAGEERFRREGTILARLAHANIAHLIDAGVSSQGQPYLVLEHIEGEPIDLYCDRLALGIDGRIRLFLDVLDAVAHAHANLIVHRDIKPSNVLVRRDGQVKLLDFGIAKLLDEETRAAGATLTVQGGGALTPEYAAPEQLTGGPVTTATDVYALGVLLYTLLCGRHPTGTAESPADLVKAIVDNEPSRPSDLFDRRAPTAQQIDSARRRATTPAKLRRLLRRDLDNIVSKALRKLPAERYAVVGAFADDLRRYLNHEPVTARPDSLTYRAATFARRHARGVAAATAAAVVLAGLVAFYTTRLASERDRARLEAAKAAQVGRVLTDLLTGADPFMTRETQTEPTVQSLLDAGSARIERELAGQPELQAEMLNVMGRTYQRLLVHDKAQRLLEQAVAIARGLGAPGEIRLAESLGDLGALLRERGDLARAKAMLEEALAIRRRLLGEHEDVAVTLVDLGRVHNRQGSRDQAEALFRESLAIRRKTLGEAHRETAVSKNDLGLLLLDRGDLAAAETMFREALATNLKAVGHDHPNVAAEMNNIGLILLERREFAEAESLFREALAIRRKLFGEKHPVLAVTMSNLAQPLRERGEYDEAAALIQDALDLAKPALGDNHPNVVTFTANLGQVQLARGDAAVAEPLLRRALSARQRILPADDWRIGTVKSMLGESLTMLGRYREAESLLLEARQQLNETAPGRQGREARANRERLATLYDTLGQPEKAAAFR